MMRQLWSWCPCFKGVSAGLGSWSPESTICPCRARKWSFSTPQTLRFKGKMANCEAKLTIKLGKKKRKRTNGAHFMRAHPHPQDFRLTKKTARLIRSSLRSENGLTTDIFVVKCSGVEKLTRLRSGKTDPVQFTGRFKQGPFCLKKWVFCKQFSLLRYRIFRSFRKGKFVFQKSLSETPFKPDRVSFCTPKIHREGSCGKPAGAR